MENNNYKTQLTPEVEMNGNEYITRREDGVEVLA